MQFSTLFFGLCFSASALAATCSPADAVATLQSALAPALGKADFSKLDKAKIQKAAMPLLMELAPVLSSVDAEKLKPLFASLNLPFPAESLSALLAAGAVM